MPFQFAEQNFDKHNYLKNNASTNALQFMECWICPGTYYSKYSKTWILKKHWHRTSLSLFYEHICFYSTILWRIYESSFHGWCRHFLFFHSVPEVKTFCTFYSINFASYLQKSMSYWIPMAAVSGKKINK